MPLTVTPGGASDDSLISLDALKARWDAIGRDYASFNDTAIEQAARRASEWVNSTYLMRFPGTPTNGANQRFHWPASGATDINSLAIDDATIPLQVENAVAEAAFREVTTPNSLSPDYVRAAQLKRRKVGPIEREFAVSPDRSDPMDVVPVLTAVENLLRPILSRRVYTGALASGLAPT